MTRDVDSNRGSSLNYLQPNSLNLSKKCFNKAKVKLRVHVEETEESIASREK